jgi:hypothetical protein
MQLTDQDGIYPLDGHIGINATAIKTGAICVGNPPTVNNEGKITNWNENVFYADINGDVVHLAGWKVTNDMLY